MDDIRKSQVRVLRRFLEKIEQELRIILSEEGGKFKTDRLECWIQQQNLPASAVIMVGAKADGS